MEYFFYFWTFNLDIEKILNNLPLHKRIYEQLRKHISEGIYKEGDLLPSENDLCNLHGVTRPTIRKALDRLTAEGFIIRQQGKGSIVKIGRASCRERV